MNTKDKQQYVITLYLTTDANPNKWNWSELLDLNPVDETLYMEISKCS